MPIFMAQIGKEYQVKKIGGLDETRRHLKILGFVTGSNVCVVAVVNKNLIVQIKDSRVALGRELAGKIIV